MGLEDILKTDKFFIAVTSISAFFLLIGLTQTVIGISNHKVQVLSAVWLVYGIIAWFLHDSIIGARSYKTDIMWESKRMTENTYFNMQLLILFMFIMFFVYLDSIIS